MSIRQGDNIIAGNGIFSDTNKANISLDNLTPDGEKHFLGNRNITNCITEIPQDIKLEVSNGSLILKSGSKYYVPNGKTASEEHIFKSVTTNQDYQITNSGTGDVVITAIENVGIGNFTIQNTFSGNTAPTVTSNTNNIAIWYDTNENFVKLTTDKGKTWTKRGDSLPLGVAFVDKEYKSIKQIFNGFGYIGSTLFSLPGVKGLAPSKRNIQNSELVNIEFTTTKVMALSPGLKASARMSGFINAENLSNSSNYWYDEYNNENHGFSVGGVIPFVNYGSYRFDSNGKVREFKTKMPFQSLDYSTPHIIESNINTVNGNGLWYRRWSDGWLEQGAMNVAYGKGYNSTGYVNLLRPYKNKMYTVLTQIQAGNWHAIIYVAEDKKQTTKFHWHKDGTDQSMAGKFNWYACGFSDI